MPTEPEVDTAEAALSHLLMDRAVSVKVRSANIPGLIQTCGPKTKVIM